MCADAFLDIAPRKSEIDLSYLLKYRSKEFYKFPTSFDKYKFKPGHPLEARITQIYDPSKFWMVMKFRELEMFQKYLFKFYYMNRTHYKIPQDEINIDLYCVTFIDNAYYRGVILGFPVNYQEAQEVQVLFIDYGMIGTASINHIYYISEKCFRVPQFAIRASLAGVCPFNNGTWTSEEVLEFHKLVANEVLQGFVLNIDDKREILEVVIDVISENSLISVQDALKSKKCARYFHDREVTELECKVKYPYLFPSHEALESGKVPQTVSDAEYQRQVAPLTSVLTRYDNTD